MENNSQGKGHLQKDQVLKSFKVHYENKEYQKAQELLDSHRSLLDPALYHFNKATTLGKKEDWVGARFHYELAKREGLSHLSLEHNLEVAKRNLTLNGLSASERTLDKVIYKGIETSSYYFLIGILLSVCLILFLWLKKKISYGIAFVSMGAIIASLGIFKFIYINHYQYGIFKEDASILEGPSRIFEEKATGFAGSMILWSKKNQDWVFITHPLDLAGWVPSSKLLLEGNKKD